VFSAGTSLRSGFLRGHAELKDEGERGKGVQSVEMGEYVIVVAWRSRRRLGSMGKNSNESRSSVGEAGMGMQER